MGGDDDFGLKTDKSSEEKEGLTPQRNRTNSRSNLAQWAAQQQKIGNQQEAFKPGSMGSVHSDNDLESSAGSETSKDSIKHVARRGFSLLVSLSLALSSSSLSLFIPSPYFISFSLSL